MSLPTHNSTPQDCSFNAAFPFHRKRGGGCLTCAGSERCLAFYQPFASLRCILEGQFITFSTLIPFCYFKLHLLNRRDLR